MPICIAPCGVLRDSPNASATAVSEVLFGESVSITGAETQGFYPVRSEHDNYAGYALASEFAESSALADFHVIARATLLFPEPSIKKPPIMRLPFGARIRSRDDSSIVGWVQLQSGGWLRRDHLELANKGLQTSPLALASTRFMNAPYLWGGRSPDGCDCSGLVQVCHAACGLPLPRDSVDQERAVPHIGRLDDRQAGDLVFWPGHVAILIDAHTVRHATAQHLSVCDEALDAVIERAGEVRAIGRPELLRTR